MYRSKAAFVPHSKSNRSTASSEKKKKVVASRQQLGNNDGSHSRLAFSEYKARHAARQQIMKKKNNNDIIISKTKEIQTTTYVNKQGQWKEKLLKVSNFASILCVLDCTILPFVTIVLPIFGIVVTGSPEQMDYLHELGHQVALYFVLPVGCTATTMNYIYSHKQKWIAAIASIGLFMILLANFGAIIDHDDHHHHHDHHHHDHHNHHHHENFSYLDQVLYAVQHGVIHRVVNVVGCALLLGSNYLSHREGCGCDDLELCFVTKKNIIKQQQKPPTPYIPMKFSTSFNPEMLCLPVGMSPRSSAKIE